MREWTLVVAWVLEGVVALEDHPILRHVTGLPSLQSPRQSSAA